MRLLLFTRAQDKPGLLEANSGSDQVVSTEKLSLAKTQAPETQEPPRLSGWQNRICAAATLACQ